MMRESHTSLSGPSWWKQSDLCCPSYCPRGYHPPLQTKTWPSHSPPDSKHWKTNKGEKIDFSFKLWVHADYDAFSVFFRPLTCQLQGRGPAASFPFGPGQSAATGSVCFWEQWTLGSFQKLHTYTLGWYTLRSGVRRNRQAERGKTDVNWRSCREAWPAIGCGVRRNRITGWDRLTSFWLEWKNLREKLHDWEASENWPRDSA